jgi:hypothetical protein
VRECSDVLCVSAASLAAPAAAAVTTVVDWSVVHTPPCHRVVCYTVLCCPTVCAGELQLCAAETGWVPPADPKSDKKKKGGKGAGAGAEGGGADGQQQQTSEGGAAADAELDPQKAAKKVWIHRVCAADRCCCCCCCNRQGGLQGLLPMLADAVASGPMMQEMQAVACLSGPMVAACMHCVGVGFWVRP